MEKYGQYRDKGSGIAPFFPTTPQSGSILSLPWALLLLFIRIPVLVFAWFVWFLIIQWAPPGTLLHKANLWCIIGIPGIWWVDLQVDGVRRGSLGRSGASHMPNSGSIIASSQTSPIDVVYLATIFDPIFTQSYPGTRLVRTVSLPAAICSCFYIPKPPDAGNEHGLTTLAKLTKQNPNRIIAVFPEGTTSNGRSILRFTHSLLSASSSTKIFPVSIRYAPQDVVTPLPGWFEPIRFLWRLNSKSSHTVRTRIGTPVTMSSIADATSARQKSAANGGNSSYSSNFFDTLDASTSLGDDDDDGLSERERKLIDAVADNLARLGRVKRVSLGVEEKVNFVQAWEKGSRSRR